MKTRLTRIVSLIAAVLMLALAACPPKVSAEGEHNPIDVEKLTAFLNQTDDEGVSNGDKFFFEYGSMWDGSYDIGFASFSNDGEILCYTFEYIEGFLDPDYDVFVEIIIAPDFYGYLDLSGTTSHEIATPGYWSPSYEIYDSHIEGLNMSDCVNLESLVFVGQDFCRELLATGCESLETVAATACDYRYICVEPKGYDAPIELRAIGEGSVELDFNSNPNGFLTELPTYCRINAVDGEGTFLGWFDASGNLISSEATYEVELGQPIEAYAWFAGDVNGDELITSDDALTILRQALGLRELECSSVLADVTGDGLVDSSDALIVLRFALGI